jgi:hypothetical protein
VLEGLFSIVAAIVEGFIALISVLVEFIAGFFVAAGETLTLIDLVAVLVVFLFELLFWLILWIVELAVSLFKWRKPKIVKKPVLWRPNPKLKKN